MGTPLRRHSETRRSLERTNERTRPNEKNERTKPFMLCSALNARTTTCGRTTTMRGLALGRRAARVGARGVGTTTRASQAESQTATSEQQQGEQSQQGGLQRKQEQKRALARSPLSSMMAFPSLMSGMTPFGLSRSMQREMANMMNLMDDMMTGGALAPFETLDPFKITMHADHTQGVPQQILNFPMGTTTTTTTRASESKRERDETLNHERARANESETKPRITT